jgi:L-alanine-DL-glutamate epimerase-like enolase superfamily enzyme
MRIVEVEVVELAVTRAKSVAKFIRHSPTIGPFEPYAEYAENRAMWTGGTDWVVPVVVIRTDDGIEGYGFCGGGTAVAGSLLIERHFARHLIGADPFDTEMLWDKMFRASVVFGQKGAAIEALSGADIALWDIKGKALGMPVYKLLGGKTRERLKLYASNLHPSSIGNPDYDLLAAEAKDYVEHGYRGVKQRMCAGPREGRAGMKRNEMLVKTVREAVGDDIEVMVEAYMGWGDVEYAAEMIKRLEKYHPAWVEEPLMPNDVAGYKRLRSKVGTPIAAGEHEFTKFGFRDLIGEGVVDIIQPDVRRAGGITEVKKIAGMAEAFGVACAPHVAYVETLHLTMSCPAIRWAEHTCQPSWDKGEGGFSDAYILGVPEAKDGFMQLSEDKPGLGIELDGDVLDRLRA